MSDSGNTVNRNTEVGRGTRQFSTFVVAGRLYGIDVAAVQEVTMSMAVTRVPLAPSCIHGLINLRGQIATAIGVRELFGLEKSENPKELMNVVCRASGTLVSLLVDQIGDVVEVEEAWHEATPETVSSSVSQFMSGVYKTPGEILSVIDVSRVASVLNDDARAS